MKNNHTAQCTNSTIILDMFDSNSDFKFVTDWLLLTILVIIMFSIGCEITWTKMKYYIRHPLGIVIGMVSQFFIIPLTTYTLLRSCGVKGFHATGVLIISCCPGGILSNAFAYFCDGDLSLSVTMTFFSTLMAMGMMPFNLWIYGNSFETENLIVPYGKVSLSLISITAPVIASRFLRWKFPNALKIITKVTKCIGFIGIIFCIVLEVIFLPNKFSGVPRNVRGILLTLPALGLSLGYILAYSFKQDMSVRKTIATECGIQNVPTAITIITSSFEPEFQDSMLLLPWLYTFAVMSGCTFFCLIYQISKQYIIFKERKEDGFTLEISDGLQAQISTSKTEVSTV